MVRLRQEAARLKQYQEGKPHAAKKPDTDNRITVTM
jgi:hypothetical protein